MPFQSRAGNALFISACLLLAGTYLLALSAPAAGTYHDDGIYLVTARALAEGKGYRIISMSGEPYQTKYPILLPWLVSLFWRIDSTFPDNLPWLRLAPLACLVTWLAVSFRLLRRLGLTRAAAWVVVLLVAASPSVLFASTAIMAEMPFGAFLAGGMLVLARIHDNDTRRYDGWLAGLLMGLSVLCRAIGATTAGAGLLALVIARRWRLAVQYAVAALLVVLPWAWFVIVHNRPLASIDAYYAASNYAAWNIVTSYTFAEKVRVLILNAVYFGMAPGLFWDMRMPTWVSMGVALVLFLVIGRALWIARRHPVALVMFVYLATVWCWVTPPLRFLTPIAPGLAWLIVSGVPPQARGVVKAVVAAITLASAFQLWGQTLERLEKGTTWPTSGPAESWPEMAPLLEWVARHTPEDAVLTGNLDPMYFLYTGRKAIRAYSADAYLLFYGRPNDPSPLGTVDDFRRRLLTTGATYLIMTPGAGFSEMRSLRKLLSELMAARPVALSEAAGNASSGYVVYEIHRDQLVEPIAASR